MLKVLHINFSDSNGGAAIAVNRLHKALMKLNVDSKILVAEKFDNDFNTIGPTSTLQILISQLKVSLSRFLKKKFIKTTNRETFSFNLFNTNILKKINQIDADVVVSEELEIVANDADVTVVAVFASNAVSAITAWDADVDVVAFPTKAPVNVTDDIVEAVILPEADMFATVNPLV